MSRFWQRVVRFWRRWEHHIGVGGILAGFIFDLFLAKRPDSVVDNLLLVSYLFIAAATIILLNVRTRRQMEQENPAEPLVLLLVLQFCFGGLASNLLVLYGHSGTLAGSTLFILLLVGLVFGNEFLRSRYAQLRFNIVVYYVLLFTYLIIAVPTFIVHAIGTWVFLCSAAVSLGIIALFLALVYAAVLRGASRQQQLYEVSMLVTLAGALIVGFYFLNIIPPVPLSLQRVGIYHSLSRDALGNYSGTYEQAPWYVFWRDTSSTFSFSQGQAAYCFSAIYAPADLETPVVHQWDYYDPAQEKWITESRSSFTIVGGRSGGYRGYSVETQLQPGQWRCEIETQGGALIGSISFDVVEASTTPVFNTATL
jgi:hypothetical protein